MIGTELYKGQGFGNQLWAYAVVRSIAKRRGIDFAILGQKRFKGLGSLNLDFGIQTPQSEGGTAKQPIERIPSGFSTYYQEKMLRNLSGADISPLDQAVLQARDGTFLDGTFQAEGYLAAKSEVQSWFQTGTSRSELCLISIRGGEFKGIPDLFLPRSYFVNAMEKVLDFDSGTQFAVVTDDKPLAASWFPELPVFSSGGVKRFHGGFYLHPPNNRIISDFSLIQSAKYLIISNSSFAWWGAYTNQSAELVIAPKYWARNNVSDGYWSNGDSLTRDWQWLDRHGQLFTYDDCVEEIERGRS